MAEDRSSYSVEYRSVDMAVEEELEDRDSRVVPSVPSVP